MLIEQGQLELYLERICFKFSILSKIPMDCINRLVIHGEMYHQINNMLNNSFFVNFWNALIPAKRITVQI